MDNSNIENVYNEVSNIENIYNENTTEVKPKQVRTKRALWRSEGDKYNNKPLSEAYFRDYYNDHLKNIYVECPHCKREIGKSNFQRHLASGKKCLKIRNLETIL